MPSPGIPGPWESKIFPDSNKPVGIIPTEEEK